MGFIEVVDAVKGLADRAHAHGHAYSKEDKQFLTRFLCEWAKVVALLCPDSLASVLPALTEGLVESYEKGKKEETNE